MLNSGKEFRDKKENILTLVFSEEKILNKANPLLPCKSNGRSLKKWHYYLVNLTNYWKQ